MHGRAERALRGQRSELAHSLAARDLKSECRCGPVQVQRYRQRISGPLLDRIDLHIEVPAVEYRDVAGERAEEGSTAIRGRVRRARERQQERFRNDAKVNATREWPHASLNNIARLATIHRS